VNALTDAEAVLRRVQEPTSLEHVSDALHVLAVGPVIVVALLVSGIASWVAAWWRWVEEQLEEM
jgi:hypothetical protein